MRVTKDKRARRQGCSTWSSWTCRASGGTRSRSSSLRRFAPKQSRQRVCRWVSTALALPRLFTVPSRILRPAASCVMRQICPRASSSARWRMSTSARGSCPSTPPRWSCTRLVIILHVQARLEARNQPLGVRNVVHIKAGPGCCKTTTGRALVKWLGEATAHHYEDDASCRTFLLEVYKARTRLAQVIIVDPAAPGAVRPVGCFDATEVPRVMGELNADPTRNYGAGAMRKAAIAEAITRPDARQQCWGSLTRWLLLDNERRSRRWESLAHDMRGLKVRCCAGLPVYRSESIL